MLYKNRLEFPCHLLGRDLGDKTTWPALHKNVSEDEEILVSAVNLERPVYVLARDRVLHVLSDDLLSDAGVCDADFYWVLGGAAGELVNVGKDALLGFVVLVVEQSL